MDVFPSVSRSVPVSAVLRLAAVEDGAQDVRNLNSANVASRLFLTASSDPKSVSVHHTSHSESSVVSEGRWVFVIVCIV